MLKIILPLLVTLSSCGYHIQNSDSALVSTLDIPFIKGDKDGSLTNALVLAVAKSGKYKYQIADNAFTLKCEIVSNSVSNIGYEYRTKDKDTQKTK